MLKALRTLTTIILPILLALVLNFTGQPEPALAQAEQVFTLEELAQNDGKDGRPSYFAYEGKVYDVSTSLLFKLGDHFGHYAGTDLTGKLDGAPHGTEVFTRFPIIGSLESSVPAEEATGDEVTIISTPQPETGKAWYESRFRFAGISILGWTGILLGIFFILTFATCFAMPWAKLPLPWAGKRPGPDELDNAPSHMGWSSIHKHFVWWAVIFGLVHGILGIMQLFGYYL